MGRGWRGSRNRPIRAPSGVKAVAAAPSRVPGDRRCPGLRKRHVRDAPAGAQRDAARVLPSKFTWSPNQERSQGVGAMQKRRCGPRGHASPAPDIGRLSTSPNSVEVSAITPGSDEAVEYARRLYGNVLTGIRAPSARHSSSSPWTESSSPSLAPRSRRTPRSSRAPSRRLAGIRGSCSQSRWSRSSSRCLAASYAWCRAIRSPTAPIYVSYSGICAGVRDPRTKPRPNQRLSRMTSGTTSSS
jgi:hypothetical protein